MTSISDDMLEGVDEIAAFLGHKWTPQRVYNARRNNSLPIRKRAGIGLYAFKTELSAALREPDSELTRRTA
jgi:hypothetical protein